ncbi:MAG: penicillin acylase family protein [Lautropia sp.]
MLDTATARTLTKVPVAKTTVAGLQSAASISRDAWGIAHVRAATTDDLFLLNGFVHAQDRIWQMEAAWRRAVGRFAEWAGPSAVAADRLARQLGCERAARRDFDALRPSTRRMLERYAEGVNAWVAAGGSAPEYRLLDTHPMRWEPWFCVAVMRQRGILMGSVWFKLWRAAALGTIGPDAVPLLRYESGGGAEALVAPQGAADTRSTASLHDLREAIEALSGFAAPDATVAGSNNWAVSGKRTRSGKPLVAGDPHRQYELPSMYLQIHLSGPEFDAIGLSVPGVPAFPHFCHTEHVAWCVTHAFADIHDLYVERFSSEGRRHVVGGTTAETRVREERVDVRGEASEAFLVYETGHGPVIAGDPREGSALTLKSVQLFDVDRSLDCLLPMLESRTLDAFYDTCRDWGVIDHNLVGADRDGRIGVLVRAKVPRRDRVNGWLPVPGWSGTHEWRGMIPFDRMPRVVDPERGFVVTANNRLVADTDADADAEYLVTDCHPDTRAARIAERIARIDRLTAADMHDILRDTDSARAREITGHLLRAGCTDGSELLDGLRSWDGRMDPGLTAPTIYYLVRQEMTRILATCSGLGKASGHPAAAPAPGIPALNHLWWTLPELLRTGDTTLLAGRSWQSVIAESVRKVAAGPAPRPWGEAHRPTFAHPLAHLFPDADAIAAPGSTPTGGDGDCVCATGAYPASGTHSVYGPIARYVFDLDDWDNSRWIVFHGVAGAAGHQHHGDQNPLWATGEMVPMHFSAAAVDAAARFVTLIEPAPG